MSGSIWMKNEVFSTMERKTRYFFVYDHKLHNDNIPSIWIAVSFHKIQHNCFSSEFTNQKREKSCIKSIPLTFTIWSVPKELKWKRLGHKIACSFCFTKKSTIMMNNCDGKERSFRCINNIFKSKRLLAVQAEMRRIGCGFVWNKHHIV